MEEEKKVKKTIAVAVVMIIIMAYYYNLPFSKTDSGRFLIGTVLLLFRIFTCIWISFLARAQGRRPLIYIICAVIFPALTLIVFGITEEDNKKSVKKVDD
jgi:hypothetical protein